MIAHLAVCVCFMMFFYVYLQSGNPSPTPEDLKKAAKLPIPKLSALEEVSSLYINMCPDPGHVQDITLVVEHINFRYPCPQATPSFSVMHVLKKRTKKKTKKTKKTREWPGDEATLIGCF